MSHFSVIVIGENVAEQLAPYNESKRTGANAKWDWWVVGGWWSDYFPLKTGGKADSCRWGDVDLDAARQAAADEARATFGPWKRSVEEHGRPLSWAACMAAHPGDKDKARALYNGQKAIIAYQEHNRFMWDCPVEALGFDEAAYVRAERKRALVPLAVVKDGKWYARGRVGWFCTMSGEMDKEQWVDQVAQLFDGLPPDAIVTIVDCHI